ncbi:ras guanine nucleotide exchange factor i-related [Anaeramoeba ignava]|uniref:Ras guanine nucleotide exchange factor i-related n=1 Tax=Anaeramoeba ignava TaxID=1746090 RepID=A0A9Q0LUT1_ANAIG|nr:ras guanine nucleotide exchange factor i-related [Anaeramoeba ignava]
MSTPQDFIKSVGKSHQGFKRPTPRLRRNQSSGKKSPTQLKKTAKNENKKKPINKSVSMNQIPQKLVQNNPLNVLNQEIQTQKIDEEIQKKKEDEIKLKLENEKQKEQEIIKEKEKEKEKEQEQIRKKQEQEEMERIKKIKFEEEKRKRELEREKKRLLKENEQKLKEEEEKRKKLEQEQLLREKSLNQFLEEDTSSDKENEEIEEEIDDKILNESYIPPEIYDPNKGRVDPHNMLQENPEIDRSEWMEKVMKRNPSIRRLTESVFPVQRAESFGMLYNAGLPEVQECLSRETVLQLVMQHLMCLGYRKTKAVIEEEAKIKYEPRFMKDSRIQTLIRNSITKVDKIWDLSLQKAQNKDEQSEILTKIGEILINLGMEEEEKDEDDVYIWDEPQNTNIIYKEKEDQIKAASLNKLVERLTDEKEHHLQYFETFLMTYQSFTTPKKLLKKLIERWHVPNSTELTEEKYNMKKRGIQIRICNVAKNWLEKHHEDFRPQLKAEMLYFVESTIAVEGYPSLAAQLKNLIFKGPKIAAHAGIKTDTTSEFDPQKIAPEPKVPKNIFSPTLSLFDVEAEEIARQLTLIDFSLYSSIRTRELLNSAWSQAKYKSRAPNVLKLIGRFNDLSAWVSASIIKADQLRKRVKILTKFIRLCEFLMQMNNFNTLMSVILGLSNSPVLRLKFTWEEVPKRHFDSFSQLRSKMTSDNDYSIYRNALKQVNPPCIPYLGVYLEDLAKIEGSEPDLIHNLINFEKRILVSGVITNLRQYQQLGYNFQPVHQIVVLLEKLPKMSATELQKRSLEIEPENADKSQIL